MAQKIGKYFTIESSHNHLILAIKNGADVPGAPVVTSEPLPDGRRKDSQLWFVDPPTGTIRSKLNKFCLDVNSDNKLILLPYKRSNTKQKWVLDHNEIRLADESGMVIGLATESREPREHACCVKNEGKEWQKWKFEHAPAQFFKLRSKLVSHKLLDVEKAKKSPGAKVIIWVDKGNLADNQLWFEDQNGILKSKLSGFALDSSKDKGIALNPFDQSKEKHHWYVWGNTIRNRYDKSKVIAVKKGAMPVLFYDTVSSESYDGDTNQLWTVEYLPDDTSIWNHGGYGKFFYIRNIQTGLVFTLKDSKLSPMTPVVMCGRKYEQQDYNDQLFYADELTCTVRTAANSYCLDMPGKTLVINPYDPFAKTQQLKIFGRKIKSKEDPDRVLTVKDTGDERAQGGATSDAGCDVNMAAYFGGDLQHFEITHEKAKCFYIRSLYNSKVLDIKGDNRSVGAEIVLWEPKKTISYNQLWYEDERGMIRSRLNGYVLHLSGRGAKTAVYDPGSKDQHWTVVGDRIQNVHNENSVLQVNMRKGLSAMGVMGPVISAKYDGGTDQKWALDHV